jgi:hypothetical protein
MPALTFEPAGSATSCAVGWTSSNPECRTLMRKSSRSHRDSRTLGELGL